MVVVVVVGGGGGGGAHSLDGWSLQTRILTIGGWHSENIKKRLI